MIEEVPSLPLPAPGVGVKRPREQTNQPVAATTEVRPTLDADPAEPCNEATMDEEGRGTVPYTIRPTSRHRMTASLPCLLPAAFPADSPRRTNPGCSHHAFTHGMYWDGAAAGLGDGSTAIFGDGVTSCCRARRAVRLSACDAPVFLPCREPSRLFGSPPTDESQYLIRSMAGPERMHSPRRPLTAKILQADLLMNRQSQVKPVP